MEIVLDPRLPQLELLLDEATLRKILERDLISARGLSRSLQIGDCRITRLKYKPGKSCLVAAELELLDAHSAQIDRQVITIWRGNEDALLFEEARGRRPSPTRIGEGVFHLPKYGAVGWIFPNDRRLFGLPALLDRRALTQQILPEIIARQLGEGWRINDVNSEVVHYVAARSCSVKVVLRLRRNQKGDERPYELFGKTYCLAEGEAAWRGMSFLWESQARQDGRLLTPQPLAFQSSSNTIWQQAFAGGNLFDARGGRRFSDLLSQGGDAIATLHQIPAPPDHFPLRAGVDSGLGAALELVAQVKPSALDRLKRLVDQLIGAGDQTGDAPAVLLHGDLHLKNLFLTNDRIALIDLDNLCLGNPWLEVASFIASVRYYHLVEKRSQQSAEEIIQPFLQAYRRKVEWEISDDSLNRVTAAVLIGERISRSITRLRPGWMGALDDLIDLATTLA